LGSIHPKPKYEFMEDKNKKVEGTTTDQSASSDKGNQVDTNNSQPDYKELLEQEKADKAKIAKQLGQAEFTIEKLKGEKKVEVDDLDLDANKIDIEKIKEEAKTEARKETEKFFLDQSRDLLEEELSKVTDPDKRELIKFHYENSIQRTGFSRSSILKDLSKAIAIVDAPRVKAESREIQKALESKESRGSANSSGQDVSKESVILPPEEEKAVKDIALRTGQKEEVVRSKLLANKRKMI